MRVLVTGGAGFIGSHIAQSLVQRGDSVAVLDNLSGGKRYNIPTQATFYEVDLTDQDAVLGALSAFRPDVISHQAAQASVKLSMSNPVADAMNNIIGGLNLLGASSKVGVQNIVFASTGGALYGEVPEGQIASEDWPIRPKSPYAGSKGAFELYLDIYQHQFGINNVILRYANVFGPRQDPHGEAGVVAIFAGKLLGQEEVYINARVSPGDDGCIRDYVYVGDVVEANLLAIDGRLPSGRYNVSTGLGRTTRDVANVMLSMLGLPEERCKASDKRPGDLERSVLSPEKLSGHGWSVQVAFEQGLAQTLDWFKRQPVS